MVANSHVDIERGPQGGGVNWRCWSASWAGWLNVVCPFRTSGEPGSESVAITVLLLIASFCGCKYLITSGAFFRRKETRAALLLSSATKKHAAFPTNQEVNNS